MWCHCVGFDMLPFAATRPHGQRWVVVFTPNGGPFLSVPFHATVRTIDLCTELARKYVLRVEADATRGTCFVRLGSVLLVGRTCISLLAN